MDALEVFKQWVGTVVQHDAPLATEYEVRACCAWCVGGLGGWVDRLVGVG